MAEEIESTESTTSPYLPATHYFTASTTKFIVMSIATLGWYDLYWFYKNWVYMRDRDNSNIWPFVRAGFSSIMAWSLFNDVAKTLIKENVHYRIFPIFFAIIFFLFGLLNNIIPIIGWVILLFLDISILTFVNTAMTQINHKVVENFQQNDRFSSWNKATIIVFLILLGIILWSLLFVRAHDLTHQVA